MCSSHSTSHELEMGDPEDQQGGAAASPRHFDQQISAKIEQLKSTSLREAALAAEFLFERAHTSHPEAEGNKDQIRRQGGIPLLCKMLSETCWEARYQACSALSELAFRNEKNCLAIVNSDNALTQVVQLLQISHGSMQEDAALVLNNCAAFCEDACSTIVEHPGLVPALKKLATGPHVGAKNVAVGALNCLSRCNAAKHTLLSHRVVEDALAPVLRESGFGDKHEARLARAAMAVANLTGRTRDCFVDEANYKSALSTAVKILGFALEGQSWAGIFFAPYSVIYPLRSLASHPDNREHLVECGLLELLTRFVKEWRKIGHHADRTLLMAIETAAALGEEQDWQQRLREAGMVQALIFVKEKARNESDSCAFSAQELLDHLLQGHMAIWMGQHGRLGCRSQLHQLDEYVCGIILNQAFGGKICFYGQP